MHNILIQGIQEKVISMEPKSKGKKYGTMFAKELADRALGRNIFTTRKNIEPDSAKGPLGCSSDVEMAIGRIFAQSGKNKPGEVVRNPYTERYNIRRMLDKDKRLDQADKDIIVNRTAAKILGVNQSEVGDIVSEEVENYLREKKA